MLAADFAVGKRAGQKVAKQIVDHEEDNDQRQRQPDCPPHCFQSKGYDCTRRDDIGTGQLVQQRNPLGDFIGLDNEVGATCRADSRKQPIINGD